MQIRELSAQRREGLGKEAAKRLRRQGRVPGILYGAVAEPVPVSLSPGEVRRIVHAHGGAGVLVNLRFPDGDEPRTALVRDLQFDPVRETLVHVDLQAVRMDEAITVEVPLHVVGEAVGVKEDAGILAVLLRTVEVSCLPSLIPDRLDIDVSALRIHDVLTVADVKPPEGVRVTTAWWLGVVTVSPPTAEEVTAPTAATPATEPEVVTERKPKEEGEDAKPEAKGKK